MFINQLYKTQVKDEYTKALVDKYYAEVIYDSFEKADNMNKWISDKTFGLIDNMVSDDQVNGKAFFLINALAIDMEWNKLIQATTKKYKDVYTVSYAHEKFYAYISLIEGDRYNSLKFNNSINAKSVEIGAVANNYDIVEGRIPTRYDELLLEINSDNSFDKINKLREDKLVLENKSMVFAILKYTDKMITLRNEILNSNFSEASDDYRQFNFYRILNDKVAFIVNLRDKGDFIEATYGFTTIVDLSYFKECGDNNDNIKLRYQKRIINDSDELNLRTEIEKVYNLYKNISKEDLLKLKKEKQKEFINKINNKLKPLGFKKKNTKWNKLLDNNFTLEIYIYKSQWSDVYYFDVSVYDPDGKDYSYNRINTNGRGTYNWQVLTDEEINDLIDYIINGNKTVSLTSIDESVISHEMAFKAENSRVNGGNVEEIKHKLDA